MKKNDSPSAMSQKASAAPQGVRETPAPPGPFRVPDAPDVRLRLLDLTGPKTMFVILIVFLAAGGVLWAVALRNAPASVGGPPAAPPSAGDWSQAPMTDAEGVCAEFIRLKNAGDPAALALLGPPPAVPGDPVSQEQADHLQADFFLRQDVRIVGAGRDKQTQGLVLYAKGNVSAPTLHVRTAGGVETAQRTMANPDLAVEVRDGRIYGVAATLHLGP